jgi:hypothetical protein
MKAKKIFSTSSKSSITAGKTILIFMCIASKEDKKNERWIPAANLQDRYMEMLCSYWKTNENPTNPKNTHMYPIYRIIGHKKNKIHIEWLCYPEPTWERCETIRKTANSLVEEYFEGIDKNQARNKTDQIKVSRDRKYIKPKGNRKGVAKSRGKEVKHTLRKRKEVKYGK